MSHLPWNFGLWGSVVHELTPSHVKAPTRADNSAKHGVLVAKNPTVAVICP
jgi:hypothetical protein